jgi:dihydroorotate dehydrogenase
MPLYPLLRRALFRLDSERAHELGIAALRALQAVPPLAAALRQRNLVSPPALRQTLLGLDFPNPVGLAAGFDKNAAVVRALPALGFGFVEVGTVTPLPQEGNPRPRMFRHPEAESLQNALGFNNRGMEAMRRRLESLRGLPGNPTDAFPLPLGVNLGKNKATPADEALRDYETLLRGLDPYADYLVVNLSSPNTPGLRDLQNESFLRALFALAQGITRKPILVKIAPDLPPETAGDLAEAAVAAGAAGLIATNTTTDYGLLPGLAGASRFGGLSGGLSGKILREKSFAILQALARRLRGRTLLISVGGVDSGAEAYRRLKAGASLVQLYTALVYQGPGLPKRINQDLLALMARDGVRSIAEVVGVEARSG